MYLIKVPLRVPVTKTKYFSLNLNQYRNTHFHELNKSKVKFKKIIEDQIQKLPRFNKISLTLTLYPKTKRLCDLDNVLSIVCKYTQDVIVSMDKLFDDDYTCIPEINFRFGKVLKNEPCVEILIKEIL